MNDSLERINSAVKAKSFPGNISPQLFLFSILSIILLYFSIAYAKLRLHGDAAYYLFRVVNDHSFYIVHNRPSAVFMEWLVLLMSVLKFKLSNIIYAFSIQDFLWWFGISLFIILKWKDYWMANCLLLISFIGIRYNYFNPVSELITAIPLYFTYIGLIRYCNKNINNWMLIGIVQLFLFFSHPLYLVILPFVLLLFYERRMLDKFGLKYTFGLMIFSLFLNYFFMDDYDRQMMSRGSEILLEGSTYFLPENRGFLLFQLQAHAGMFLLLIWLFAALIIIRSWKILSLFLMYAVGYAVFIIFSQQSYFPYTMEPFERYMFPFTVLLITMVYVFIPLKRWPFILLVLVICIYQGIQLKKISKDLSVRHQQLINVIDIAANRNQSKVIVDARNFYPYFTGHNWMMGTESLLLSSARYESVSVQVILREACDSTFLASINDSQFVEYPWWVKNTQTLNSQFFNLKSQRFKALNTYDADSLDNSESTQMQALFESPINKLDKGQKITTSILLINSGKDTVLSGVGVDSSGISVSFIKDSLGLDDDASEIKWLLSDIYPKETIRQQISFKAPKTPGRYQLKLTLTSNQKSTGVLIGKTEVNVN